MSIKDFFNKVSNSDKIYYAEEIGNMSPKDFRQNEPAINYQMNNLGIPREHELANSDEVYVKSYTRDDGTKVRAYYRSRPGHGVMQTADDTHNRLFKGGVNYNIYLNENRMTDYEQLQYNLYTGKIGEQFPIAHDNLMNALHDFENAKKDPNATIINNRAELKDPNINYAMSRAQIPQNSKGIIYNANSNASKQLETSPAINDFIAKNKQTLKAGTIGNDTVVHFKTPQTPQVGFFANTDNYIGIQHATLVNPHIDNNGYFNTIILDYYDFTKRKGLNPFNIPNNWGADLQDRGLLDNYFNMYYIHKKVE